LSFSKRPQMKLAKTLTMFVVAVLVVGTLTASCGLVGADDVGEERPMPEKSIEIVLQEHTSGLMAISGVVGTAQGLCSGEPCIRVFVLEKTEDLLKQIPLEIEGYPVSVEKTGEFRKQNPR